MANRNDVTGYMLVLDDLPSSDDPTDWIGYIMVFLLACWMMLCVSRFLISLAWPVLIVASTLILFRILRIASYTEFVNILTHAIELIIDTGFDLWNKWINDNNDGDGDGNGKWNTLLTGKWNSFWTEE
nr:uncharacterized protein LOC108060849 [Drosophila takahashii]